MSYDLVIGWISDDLTTRLPTPVLLCMNKPNAAQTYTVQSAGEHLGPLLIFSLHAAALLTLHCHGLGGERRIKIKR